MATVNAIEVEGTVVEALPNTLYRVRLANGHEVLGHVAGKRRSEVKFAPGDKVVLVVSFFDLSQGRIKLV
ncbi:MAG: translation initiation factor [Verrucomicrobiota bacterium]|jgi:translation initiation factor IF-1